MYLPPWVEFLRGRRGRTFSTAQLSAISPVVWALGLTSLLTDVSAEMVNSVLPAYLILHLRLSPLQYGAVDGIYNGFSMVLVGLLAGWLADRTCRQKEVAAAGYGLSAVCKLLMLAAGGAWGSILLATGLDRLGKGIRTAPRDAIISLNTPAESLASAFGVHRAMDSVGALAGPLVAFAILARMPDNFDALWIVSFVFACLGIAALWLFVPKSLPTSKKLTISQPVLQEPAGAEPTLFTPKFRALLICSMLLAALTISDGFIYLLLQEKGGTGANYIPLFYVLTAGAYMVFAFPVGRIADRVGRTPILLAGYVALLAVDGVLLFAPPHNSAVLVGCMLLLGLYYAGTEGVLAALASSLVPPGRRATGLAFIATGIGMGKLLSSLMFGWLWQLHGATPSILVFAGGLTVAMSVSLAVLRFYRFV